MHAAVVELDALPDSVGSTAEDDHLASIARRALALGFVGGIEVGRVRDEFRGAGVDASVNRQDAVLTARGTDAGRILARSSRDLRVAEPESLGRSEPVGRRVDRALGRDDPPNLAE